MHLPSLFIGALVCTAASALPLEERQLAKPSCDMYNVVSTGALKIRNLYTDSNARVLLKGNGDWQDVAMIPPGETQNIMGRIGTEDSMMICPVSIATGNPGRCYFPAISQTRKFRWLNSGDRWAISIETAWASCVIDYKI